MALLSGESARLSADVARLSLDMQMGKEPDGERLRAVATDMRRAHSSWELLISRLRLSSDFQSREYWQLTAAHLREQGTSFDVMNGLVKWQTDAMLAFAEKRIPPPLPPGVDVSKLSSPGSGMPPMAGGMPTIDSTPFDQEAILGSEVVADEYKRLCTDHAALVSMGEGYSLFDPLGKIAFLDALESVEERWQIFYSRFELTGQLNADFTEQTQAFLSQMGLSVPQFHKLIQCAHDAMRGEAEEERDRAP